MTKIKIIAVHYGRIKTTLACLASFNLCRLNIKTPERWPNGLLLGEEIIVVNNSQTSITNKIKGEFPNASVINNPKNLGYAAALNIGIKLALKNNPQFILIVNNDVTVKKDFFHQLVAFSKKHRAEIISPKILDQDDNIWFNGGEIDKNRFTAGHTQGKLDFLSGCCLLIRTEVFKKIGFFDEEYFMYYEDVDFCLRARKGGFKLGIADKAIVYHQIKQSKKGSKLMEYYLARNHLLFVKKHAPLFVKIREIVRLPKTLWEHLRKKEWEALKGIRDFLLFMSALKHLRGGAERLLGGKKIKNNVLLRLFYPFLTTLSLIFAVYSPLTEK